MVKACPFCKNSTAKTIYKTKKYSLVSCANCSLAYLTPMPTSGQIKKIYQQDYFKNDKDLTGGYSDYQSMEKVLEKESRRRIKFIKTFTNKNKLLDLGCGLGTFLEVARKADFNVSGNDISSYAQEEVKDGSKIPFYPGEVSKANLPKESFDIITAWDVFEHIPQVNQTAKTVYKSLKPGGYLFLSTPNIKSWDSRLLKKYWYGYKKIPEHLVFFSPASIKKILEKNGFNLIAIKTWGFERDLNFLAKKASIYIPGVDKILGPVMDLLRIKNKSLFLPLTDMMVVARKNESNN